MFSRLTVVYVTASWPAGRPVGLQKSLAYRSETLFLPLILSIVYLTIVYLTYVNGAATSLYNHLKSRLRSPESTMINLGLIRITQLIKPSNLPWKAIHVAGTNGKGSVCAYLTSVLHATNIPVGRFTSPHLINRWDCITIQNRVVSEANFVAAESEIKRRKHELGLSCTEFELLTATAFELFTRAQVAVAVVEVGMGGRLDATNIFENPLATVITNVGLDHQNFLGNSLTEIAAQKAGILKPGSPVICDASNEPKVCETISEIATEIGTGPVIWASPESADETVVIQTKSWGSLVFEKLLPGRFQPYNLSCAVSVLDVLSPQFPDLDADIVTAGIASTKWPGRLQWCDVSELVGYGSQSCLLDGAHNPAAAVELAAYVDLTIRSTSNLENVVWVIAASEGKDFNAMLGKILRPRDSVVATSFGEVDGMPWVKPAHCSHIAAAARNHVGSEETVEEEPNSLNALRRAYMIASQTKGRVVVAGSLYLVGDTLRKVHQQKPN